MPRMMSVKPAAAPYMMSRSITSSVFDVSIKNNEPMTNA